MTDDLLKMEIERLKLMLSYACDDVVKLTGCKKSDYMHDLSTRSES